MFILYKFKKRYHVQNFPVLNWKKKEEKLVQLMSKNW